MPEIVGNMETVIGRMYEQLGVRWPNPWWPTGNSGYDDCAACVSWALWGLNGNQPFQTIVSGIIERSGLPFIAGNGGIQRGDLIGFRWSTDVNYDHMEVALNSPDGAGNFQTIGTNAGPGDNMAVRTRNIAYVHNYARPNYPGSPVTIGEDMPRQVRRPDGEIAIVGEMSVQRYGNMDQVTSDAKLFGNYVDVTEGEYGQILNNANIRRDAFLKTLKDSAPVSSSTGGVTKAEVSAIVAAAVKSIKTTVTGAKNAILLAIKALK